MAYPTLTAERVHTGDQLITLPLTDFPQPEQPNTVRHIERKANPVDGGHYYTFTFDSGNSLTAKTGQKLPVTEATSRTAYGDAYRNGEGEPYIWTVVDRNGDEMAHGTGAATREDVSASIAAVVPGMTIDLVYVDLGWGV